MAQRLQPEHPDYVCPPSELDPRPSESATKFQRHNAYAFEHRDDGWHVPTSSEDPPPSHSS